MWRAVTPHVQALDWSLSCLMASKRKELQIFEAISHISGIKNAVGCGCAQSMRLSGGLASTT